MSLVKSFFTISGLTLISRIFGFVRDILIANFLGAGRLAEVFLVAFKLPNFFRRLFAEGAFSAAFVPMFSGKLAAEGHEQARDFAEKTLSVMLFFLLAFVLVMQVAMPVVMYGLAPGFADDREKFDLAVYLTRVTFPYLLFISLVSLFSGVLNSLGKFAAMAGMPILLNICLISALLFLSEYTETPAHALAYGVAVAGVVQFVWIAIACARAGMLLRPRRPRMSPEIREFLRKMLPGIVGAGVVQINLWIDVIIGTFIPGAIAYLYYADRVNQLPLSIVGTAMGVALLPMLSKQIRENKKDEAIKSQNNALEMVLFFSFPAMAALIVIAPHIVTVLFERGEFGTAESTATAYALMAYAVGLPAFVMVKVFSSVFFAGGDTKTPVKVAIIAMLANLVMNISFVFLLHHLGYMPHIGLALATSLASWLNITILYIILKKQNKIALSDVLKKRVFRMLLATILMVITLWLGKQYLQPSIINLIILISLGKLTYFLSAHLLKAFEITRLKQLLNK